MSCQIYPGPTLSRKIQANIPRKGLQGLDRGRNVVSTIIAIVKNIISTVSLNFSTNNCITISFITTIFFTRTFVTTISITTILIPISFCS